MKNFWFPHIPHLHNINPAPKPKGTNKPKPIRSQLLTFSIQSFAICTEPLDIVGFTRIESFGCWMIQLLNYAPTERIWSVLIQPLVPTTIYTHHFARMLVPTFFEGYSLPNVSCAGLVDKLQPVDAATRLKNPYGFKLLLENRPIRALPHPFEQSST